MARKTTRSPEVQLPPQEELKRLKLSPEVAHYLITRGIPLPTCPPLFKTPEPGELLATARFDGERVDKVIAAFRRLRHTQGQWAGRPLNPDPWQVAYILAPVFGWVKRNRARRWVRVVRVLYVEVPRKNGKTTTCGGIAIYLTAADGEQGAQVVAAATTADQANFVFAPIKQIAERSPALKPYVKALAKKIIHKATGSYFAVVSSAADAQHGANIHGAVVDELHLHKSPELVEAIETGTGSREQPLVAKITTADDGKPNTIYARTRKRIEELARRVIKHPATYGVVFAAAESEEHLRELGLDPFGTEAMRRANPGFGISPTQEYLETKASEARQDPAALATYLRLHLGIRTKQVTKYIALSDWDTSAGLVDEAALAGRRAHGGLDLSNVEDITALCWVFPEAGGDSYQVVWRFWLPEDQLKVLNKRTAGSAEVWAREGWLKLTPGNVIDNDAIVKQIDEDAQKFRVVTVGYDRWGATDVVRRLGDGGLTCVPISQGIASMNEPLKSTLRLVKGGRLLHGGNPVMRWMVDNLAVVSDSSGNVKPDKANSGDKIDGVSALMNALKEAMAVQEAEKAPPATAPAPPPGDDRNLWRPSERLTI
ncbi:terminase [Sphaerisporangium siamense]|uniref:Phage terminase large subunit-like protein n=1 Tax=Sphaerisporangium siamense TaxID=795645 RepID=A0A7W7G985_9ACTN|nr:terminase TerL endonuclease subunit [Sphaerisporangium siamense]MBB4702563.1 phage terminase large subunit-like protein [Sphaerisporangium siamense]GII88265.1 terminase [Sphaerisporangium siamense]